jgi:multiple sugar transport system ATP-binding protein
MRRPTPRADANSRPLRNGTIGVRTIVLSGGRLAEITFEHVGKTFADGTRAVADLSLAVGDGEFIVLVGPSGCGKTTALRMVAGLEEITEGAIRIGDRVVNDVPAKDRDVAMVFQSYALYPHMSVTDNMAFGLKLRGVARDEITTRVQRAADMLGLSGLLDRKPRALSGGQRQRVAMGRAIVREPQVFLMDEPLSNLDAKLRVQVRAEISSLQRRLRTTTIYVTHDQVEAMTMGERVAVMRKGVLQQVAPPQELYDRPVNVFVGGFIGSPAMNLIAGTPRVDDGAVALDVRAARLPVAGALASALRSSEGSEVVVGIRPEHVREATDAGPGHVRMPGRVVVREPLGAEVVVHVEIEATPAVTDDVRELAADTGEEQTVAAKAGATTTTVVARFGPRTRAREGERMEIAIDPSAVHVFDARTGMSLSTGGGT